jgi:hypothetical protein
VNGAVLARTNVCGGARAFVTARRSGPRTANEEIDVVTDDVFEDLWFESVELCEVCGVVCACVKVH